MFNAKCVIVMNAHTIFRGPETLRIYIQRAGGMHMRYANN